MKGLAGFGCTVTGTQTNGLLEYVLFDCASNLTKGQ